MRLFPIFHEFFQRGLLLVDSGGQFGDFLIIGLHLRLLQLLLQRGDLLLRLLDRLLGFANTGRQLALIRRLLLALFVEVFLNWLFRSRSRPSAGSSSPVALLDGVLSHARVGKARRIAVDRQRHVEQRHHAHRARSLAELQPRVKDGVNAQLL